MIEMTIHEHHEGVKVEACESLDGRSCWIAAEDYDHQQQCNVFLNRAMAAQIVSVLSAWLERNKPAEAEAVTVDTTIQETHE